MKLTSAVIRGWFRWGFAGLLIVGLFIALSPAAAFADDGSADGNVTTTQVELENVYWSTTQYGMTSVSSGGSVNVGAALLVGEQQVPIGAMVIASGGIDAMHAHINHADYSEAEQDIDFSTQQQGETAISGSTYEAIGIGALGVVNENEIDTMHGHINVFGGSLPYDLDYYVDVPVGEFSIGPITVAGSTIE